MRFLRAAKWFSLVNAARPDVLALQETRWKLELQFSCLLLQENCWKFCCTAMFQVQEIQNDRMSVMNNASACVLAHKTSRFHPLLHPGKIRKQQWQKSRLAKQRRNNFEELYFSGAKYFQTPNVDTAFHFSSTLSRKKYPLGQEVWHRLGKITLCWQFLFPFSERNNKTCHNSSHTQTEMHSLHLHWLPWCKQKTLIQSTRFYYICGLLCITFNSRGNKWRSFAPWLFAVLLKTTPLGRGQATSAAGVSCLVPCVHIECVHRLIPRKRE